MHLLNASLMTQLRQRHLHALSVVALRWDAQWFAGTEHEYVVVLQF